MTDDALIGQLVDGRFRLERLLGSGGMGKVYAATQLSVNREVAVKVLRSDLSEVQTLQQRFFQEAQLIASLRHPNVVTLVDFGRDEQLGSLYIVMEYVVGRSLTDVLKNGRLPLVLALSICRQICSGLAEAHAAGIVHRDLKPDNVMLQLTAEGRLAAKLLDFGIALPQGRDETRFTATGAVLGTPHYMAPEQAQDRPVTQQSDLYSLGVILYEAIAGTPPFHADTPLALLFKTVNEHHTPVTDILAGVDLPPSAVTDLLDELLAKDPALRPPSAAELGRRLDQLILDLPVAVPVLHSLDDLDQLVSSLGRRGPSVGFEGGSTARDDELAPVPKAGASLGPIVALMLFLMIAIVVGGAVAGALIWVSVSKDAPAVHADAPVPAAPEPLEPLEPLEPTEPGAPDPVVPAELEPEPEPEPELELELPRLEPKKAKKPKRKAKKRKTRPINRPHVACQRGPCSYDLKKEGASAVCQGATCFVECTAGGCRQGCQGKSTCEFACAGGGCTQQCFPPATCTFSCDGGGCSRTAFDGSHVTELD